MLSQRFIFLLVLFACYYVGCRARRRGLSTDKEDTNQCPRITVTRKSIIRTRASIADGARLLHKREVESAKQCYFFCCKRKDCDTAIMHYLRSKPAKMCYMFYCGTPSVCTFVPHDSYAVIRLLKDDRSEDRDIEPTESPATVPTAALEVEATEKPEPTKKPLPEEVCPKGSPVAMCAADPCEIKKCAGFPEARCQASFCGGCFAHFYDDNAKRIHCKNKDGVKDKPRHAKAHQEQDKDRPKSENSNVNEDLVVVSSADGGGLPTEDPDMNGEDPYAVKEYREWLDGPKKGQKKHLQQTTTKPRDVVYTNSSVTDRHIVPDGTFPTKITKVVVSRFSFSLPLLLAMLICIVILTGIVWRMRCTKVGKKGKKFAVDDGDYLINGMYL